MVQIQPMTHTGSQRVDIGCCELCRADTPRRSTAHNLQTVQQCGTAQYSTIQDSTVQYTSTVREAR